MTRPIRPGAVAALRERLRGRLVSPDDAGYDTARKVWNGRIDRRPFLVVFCADDKEVVVALRFAREHELLVAVRGGGHSCAGTAVCGDGLVIDLSHMKAIEVDAAARSAQPRAECCGANSTAQLKPSVWRFPAGRIPRSALPDLRWAAAMVGSWVFMEQLVTISCPQMS